MAVKTLKDGEFIDGRVIMVSLTAVMLSGRVIAVGRLSVVTHGSELAESVIIVLELPTSAVIAPAGLADACSIGSCPPTALAVTDTKVPLVSSIQRDKIDGMIADICPVVVILSGVGMMGSKIIFASRG